MPYMTWLVISGNETEGLSNWEPNTMLFLIGMWCLVFGGASFILAVISEGEKYFKSGIVLILLAIVVIVLSGIFGHTVE